MGFKERISILLDVDGKAGQSGFKSFGGSIRDADGTMNKFKAGASSAMDSVKANAGAFALAGGAALVAFGVKALGAFTDMAMGARDLGAATGLAVEDASRWIAIADDMGLTAGDLTAGLGAITKTLDADKWEKYGIATRDAGGNARDANAILLDTFDLLSKETNLTERARLGKELLGKGYASLAPMIGKSRAEYEKMLGAVEDGQVITQKELEKAQRMAQAQDSLSDALNEVTLAVGQYVAEMAPTIEAMSSAVTTAIEWKEALGPIPQAINAIINPVGGLIDGYGMLSDEIDTNSMSLEELTKLMADNNITGKDAAGVLEGWHKANGTVTESTDTLADAVEAAAVAAEDAAAKEKALADALLKLRDDALNAASSMWDVEEATLAADGKYAEYVASLTDGKTTMAEYRQSQIDQVQSLTDLAVKEAEAKGAVAGSREGVRLQIAALEDMRAKYPLLSADIDAYILKLKAIPTSVHTSITTAGVIGTGGSGKKYADGTNSAAPGLALVGEEGPEIVDMGRGGQRVYTATESAAMLSRGGSSAPQIVQHFHGVTTGSDLAKSSAREIGWMLRMI